MVVVRSALDTARYAPPTDTPRDAVAPAIVRAGIRIDHIVGVLSFDTGLGANSADRPDAITGNGQLPR
jgi:hypothetical protein